MEVPEYLLGLLKAEAEFATLMQFRRYIRAMQDTHLLNDLEVQERYRTIVIERHRLELELVTGFELLRRN